MTMGVEAEESSKTTKFPFLSVRPMMQSPERSGIATPPIHTIASVPFRWEEEPGKPKSPCKVLSMPISDYTQKCLELPPGLLKDAKSRKLPLPKSILEGPYVGRRPKLQDSSFRMARDCYTGGSSWSPERWFTSWGKKKLSLKNKREISGGSYVFPSSSVHKENEGSRDDEEETSLKTSVTMKRVSGSGRVSPFLSQAKSHILSTICRNLKQVVPWKRGKGKKGDMVIKGK